MTEPRGSTVIAGTRPTGTQASDSTHRWVSYRRDDGTHYLTRFDGWLIVGETRTSDDDLAEWLVSTVKEWSDPA